MFQPNLPNFITVFTGVMFFYTFIYNKKERKRHKNLLLKFVDKFENLTFDDWLKSTIKFTFNSLNWILMYNFPDFEKKQENTKKNEEILKIKAASVKYHNTIKYTFKDYKYWNVGSLSIIALFFTLSMQLVTSQLSSDLSIAYITDIWIINSFIFILASGILKNNQREKTKDDYITKYSILNYYHLLIFVTLTLTFFSLLIISQINDEIGTRNMKTISKNGIMHVIQFLIIVVSLNIVRVTFFNMLKNKSLKKALIKYFILIVLFISLIVINYIISKAIIYGLENITYRLDTINKIKDIPSAKDFQFYFACILSLPFIPLAVAFIILLLEILLTTFNKYIKNVISTIFKFLVNKRIIAIIFGCFVTYTIYIIANIK